MKPSEKEDRSLLGYANFRSMNVGSIICFNALIIVLSYADVICFGQGSIQVQRLERQRGFPLTSVRRALMKFCLVPWYKLMQTCISPYG